jgi:hypothetical protein
VRKPISESDASLLNRKNQRPGNVTIAFHSDGQDSCESDPSSGLVLTTSTLPNAYTCFNVSDIFSQKNSTGFQNATQHIYTFAPNGTQVTLEPNGVDWWLGNQGSFDSKANYSRIWYNQVNQTDAEAGEAAGWVLYIYAFDDCEQLGDDNSNPDDFPWFESSCQTEEAGQCQTVPYSIKSFAIHSATDYNKARDGCNTWAYMGAAGTFRARTWQVVAASAGLAGVLLL